MDFIKNKEQVLESVNELINSLGTPDEIAQIVDDVIFESMQLMCEIKQVADSVDYNKMYALRQIRDFLRGIQLNEKQ